MNSFVIWLCLHYLDLTTGCNYTWSQEFALAIVLAIVGGGDAVSVTLRDKREKP